MKRIGVFAFLTLVAVACGPSMAQLRLAANACPRGVQRPEAIVACATESGLLGRARARGAGARLLQGGDQKEMIDLQVRGRKKFEDIPFNSVKSSMRRDLVDLLITMGLCSPRQAPEALFLRANGRFGFASLIRCSVSMRPPGKTDYVFSGSGILERTVRSGQKFVVECVQRHLLPLPPSVRLVVMLSSSKEYIDACRDLFDGEWVDPAAEYKCAYRVKGIPFVHVPHPSGQAAGFRAVFNGKRGPTDKEKGIPECRRQALAVVAAVGFSAIL
jgi:hypothetical protein